MSQPTQNTVSPDLDELWRQWRDMTVENFAWMAGQAASGEAFTNSAKAMNDAYLVYSKKMREMMGQSMDALELPKRSDLARISTQVLTVESRVADLEDRLDGVQAELGRFGRLLEDIKSSLNDLRSLEAGMARIEGALRERSEAGCEPNHETGEPTEVGATNASLRRKK